MPPPQLASNIPTATESATEKQVVGACAPMNDYPQRSGFGNDVSVGPTWRIAERAIVSLGLPAVECTGLQPGETCRDGWPLPKWIENWSLTNVQQRLVHRQGIGW